MPALLETGTPEACADLCVELGLQFVELNMNLPQYQLQELDAGRLRRISESRGIYFTLHLDENLNPCDFNPWVADAWLKTAAEAVRFAGRLGMPTVNMHLPEGVYFTLPQGKVYLFDQYMGAFLDRLALFRHACEQAAGESGVRVCVENTGGWSHEFSRRGLALLLDSEVFGLTLDVGHNHGAGGGDELIILSREEKLCHLHLHDAMGKRDHLALGEGELDVKRYMELAQRRRCRVVLETKTVKGLRLSAAKACAMAALI